MNHEIIPMPDHVDYHGSNADDNPLVLRVNGDTGRYICHMFTFSVGDVGGDYDSLTDRRSISLTRQQVSDLTQHLVKMLASNP